MRSALAFAACLLGCLSKPTFECADSAACLQNGVQGTCQPDRLCSFPDSSCPSGQRYGDLSGAQANQCVGGGGDAGIDAGACLGGGTFALCVPASTDPVMLSGTLDTDSDPRCTPPPASWLAAGQPDACVILGALAIANTSVTGSKVLVLAGDAITLEGTLDVASHRGGATGPGAPFAGCDAFVAGPENAPQGGAGGAGASFKTRGGNGGDGDGVGTDGGIPAMAAADPTVLRAGCAGQVGGTGSAAAGARGQGGGAVYLAAHTITFAATGAINASGSGGTGGGQFSGGSGGGSGGMIVLHATAITGAPGARVLANGGGGAQGASFGGGANGGDPNPATPTTPAQGGSGGSGGPGGNGFAGMTQAQAGGQNQNRGGGGGGGGGGYIQSNLALANITASPAATIVP